MLELYKENNETDGVMYDMIFREVYTNNTTPTIDGTQEGVLRSRRKEKRPLT